MRLSATTVTVLKLGTAQTLAWASTYYLWWSARLASALHPIGATVLALVGAPATFVFAVLHGSGNGIMTIAKGTLQLALFDPQGYGERQGVLLLPARLAQALAPWWFGLCITRWGAGALWISAGLGMLASAALWLLGSHADADQRTDSSADAASPEGTP